MKPGTSAVFRKDPPRELPVTAGSVALFRLGELCNHNCPMCPNSEAPELWLLPEQELLRRVAFLADSGFRRVVVTGGEPTVHPAFSRVVEELQRNGIQWDLNTHGGGFAPQGAARRALDRGLRTAIVSLHSHQASVSCWMSGTTPTAHAETIEGIMNLTRAGATVMINCVLSTRNRGTLADFLRHCVGRFGTGVSIKLTFPLMLGRGRHWAGSQLRYSEVADEVRCLLGVAQRLGVTIELESFPNCIVGDHGFRNAGRSRFGETHYLEDRTGQTLRSIVYLDALNAVYGVTCRECRALLVCPGVSRQYAERFGLAELTAFDEGEATS